jgi:hypothetical protein
LALKEEELKAVNKAKDDKKKKDVKPPGKPTSLKAMQEAYKQKHEV